MGILPLHAFEYRENAKKGIQEQNKLYLALTYIMNTGKCTPMSLFHGIAAFAGPGTRLTEGIMDARIAQGMRRMKTQLEIDNGKGALLPSDIETVQSWDESLINHVESGIAISPGRWWNPRILEYYISLLCPEVYLVYFMEYRYDA